MEAQEMPRAEKELDKDAVSRLFSSNYTMKNLPMKTLGMFRNFKIGNMLMALFSCLRNKWY
jgi:hypothetical protein